MNKYAINGFLALARKQIIRIFRIYVQVIFPPLISQSLYFIIFGGVIGSQINNINGLSYMEFIIPGLIMMSIIVNSFSNVATTTYGSKFARNIEEIYQSPIPKYAVVLGYGSGGVMRGIINGSIVMLLAFLFVQFSVFNFFLVVLFGIMTSFFFSMLGYLAGLFSKTFDQVSIVPTFILTPLTYLGGVFYDINDLPGIWQTVSKFNPIFYIIDGFRYSFYGSSSLNVFISFSVLLFASLLIFLINWRLSVKGVGIKS